MSGGQMGALDQLCHMWSASLQMILIPALIVVQILQTRYTISDDIILKWSETILEMAPLSSSFSRSWWKSILRKSYLITENPLNRSTCPVNYTIHIIFWQRETKTIVNCTFELRKSWYRMFLRRCKSDHSETLPTSQNGELRLPSGDQTDTNFSSNVLKLW